MLKRFALSVSSGIILGICWVEITGFFPLVFIGLVPFLILEDEIFAKKLSSKKVYVHAFIVFAIFNLITSWWIYHASPAGLFMAVVFGSVLAAFPFWFFHLTRKYVGSKEGYIAFVINILAFEWVDYNWPLSHPWLPFGNVFAGSPNVIQWYEFTGVSGGSLWVILLNLILFFGWKKFTKTRNISSIKPHLISLCLGLFFPILVSFFILNKVEIGENNEKIGVVLTQPNVNPYQKFSGYTTALDQTKTILSTASKTISSATELIIAPETAFPMSLEESGLKYASEVELAKIFLKKYPKAKLLTGASTHAYFDKKESAASREMQDGDGFYEVYNSALLIGLEDSVSIYHKTKLVLGTETLPFQFVTKPLEELFDLGGTTGTLGVSKEPINFKVGNAIVAPTICYESIYGEYIGEFCKNGATLISVSTNDAWWYDTPGYKQLLAYTRLRAIENRKWIARSANTGISCFINPKGEIVKQTKWEEKTSIAMDVPLMEATTFYSVQGDFLSRIAMLLAPLLLLLTFVRKVKHK